MKRTTRPSLESAFAELISAMEALPGDRHDDLASVPQAAEKLIEPLSQLGQAMEDADLRHLLLDFREWDTINSTGQWARCLLQLSHAPDREKVTELLTSFFQRGVPRIHLLNHVRRFQKDALAARARLAGAPTVAPSQWITVSEAGLLSAVSPGVISRAVDAGEIASNGKKGKARRLDSADFNRWHLERAAKPAKPERDEHIQARLTSGK